MWFDTICVGLCRCDSNFLFLIQSTHVFQIFQLLLYGQLARIMGSEEFEQILQATREPVVTFEAP